MAYTHIFNLKYFHGGKYLQYEQYTVMFLKSKSKFKCVQVRR